MLLSVTNFPSNYFRDHVPKMTEMVQPLRKLVGMKKYKGSKKLTWTDEAIEAFHCCRVAVSNCQELYFLEDTVTPILQTGIGGYLYMIVAYRISIVRTMSQCPLLPRLGTKSISYIIYTVYYLHECIMHITK